MKLIPLTQGQFAKVDDKDFERFGGMKWCASWRKNTKSFYAVRSAACATTGKRKTKLLHREVLNISDPKIKGDHINHDTLDCQRRNLRACANETNQANRKGAQSNSASGIRGVNWRERDKRWLAHIQVRGRRIHIGSYLTSSEAASAYASANKKYFGAFGGNL